MWTAMAPAKAFALDAAQITALWPQLHGSDREPLPQEPRLLAAWVHFHCGEFRQAFEAGKNLGLAGATVASKAACIYADYLEPDITRKQEIFWKASQDAALHLEADPYNANAYFLQALALARYSQGIRVARALALGLGRKIQLGLANAIRLQPLHASAHIALGAFHADIIDKLGELIGNMTYGAQAKTSLCMLQQGVNLAPLSPVGMLEYARALITLEGDARLEEAQSLCAQAAAMQPLDAKQALEVRRAQAMLADWPG